MRDSLALTGVGFDRLYTVDIHTGTEMNTPPPMP